MSPLHRASPLDTRGPMPGYQTKQECVAIAGVADLQIRSLLDRQQYTDPLGEAEAMGISSAAWPLFGLLWPSSMELAIHMGRRPLVAGERILEVGCGLALASLVSHRRGADVTATDCHPHASRFLGHNVLLNGMAPLPYRHGHWADPAQAPVQVRDEALAGRFSLIIGSDVLYERDESGQLCAFIGRHALPQAEVLIVDPNRGNRSAFNRRMGEAGFVLSETDLSHARPGEAAYRGRLLSYRREGLPVA